MSKVYLATQDWVNNQIQSLSSSGGVSLQKGLQVTYGTITHKYTQTGSSGGHAIYTESGGTATISHMVNLLFIWVKVDSIFSGIVSSSSSEIEPCPTISVLAATPSGNICTSGKLVLHYGEDRKYKVCNVSMTTTATSATITAKANNINQGDAFTFYYAALKLY